jgi:hypothetical protein
MALVGWWPLNGTLEDNSINKNTLINSGASVALSGPLGKCYELIEASDKLTCGPNDTVSSWFNIKPFSVAAWVYFNSTDNANYGIFTIGTAATEQMLHIVKRNNKLYYGFYDDDCQSNITFTANTWYHIVCTWDSVTRDKRIYINGILDTQTTSSGYLNVPENSQLYIGSYAGLSAPINGKICDVRVYNHVLSVKEIKELAKCKVLHYTFNQFQEPTTNLWVTDLGLPTNVLINDNSTTSLIQPFYIFSSITTADAGRKYSISLDYEILMNDTLDDVLYFQVQKYLGSVFKNAIWTKYIYYSNGIKGKIIDTFTIPPNDGTWDTIKIKYATALKTDGVDYNSKVCTVQLSNIQIEKKDHATPFVDGSRTGKVYDCSGYNNNADLTEDTTPKWVKGGPVGTGYYEFNGSNNITLPYKIFNDNINQRWTVCGWAYVEDNTIPNQYLNNFNLGNKLVHSSDGRGLLYINSGVNDAYTYTNGAVPTKNWFHIAYVLNTDIQRCDIYINGELNASSTNYTETDVPYGFSNSTAFGTNLVGKLSDIRIYGTDLSSDDIRELYQARISVDRGKSIYCNEIKEDKYVKPILDYSTWTVGTSGSQPGFNINGSSTENYIIESSDPFGNIIPIWEARPDATSGPDGGWNSTPAFNIDNTKCYRFSTWVKRTVKGNGHFYLGLYGYNSTGSNIGVLNRSSGTVNTNPYFQVNEGWGEWESGLTDKWYLVVGHVFPAGSGTGSNHPESGVYNLSGTKVRDAELDFVWQPDVVKAIHRSYLFYSTDTTTRQQWCYPRVDVCDGSEPTIADLLNGVDYEHYKILEGEESSGSIRKIGLIKVNEVNSIGPTNGLVLYMPLNGNTKDYSGNKYDGVNYGATIVQGLGNKLAYEFDGSNDYILINNGIFYSSNINSFTLHFVFKRYGTSSNECLLCSRTTLGYGVSVFLLNNGYIRFDTASTSQMYQWSTNKRIAEGQEVTIDCVYTPGNKYLYINGVLEASTTSAPTTLGYLSQNFTTIGMSQINGSSYDNPLGGRLQDVRIYDRALSPQEISWLYDMYNPNKNTGAKVFNNNIIYADSFKEGY